MDGVDFMLPEKFSQDPLEEHCEATDEGWLQRKPNCRTICSARGVAKCDEFRLSDKFAW